MLASRCHNFVVGFKLAVLLTRGTFPLNANDHWQVRGFPGGACTEAIDGPGPVLVALLTALGDVRKETDTMSELTEAFEHWCEVCGKTEVMTSEEAYRTGWDFPPRMGQWGVISPRTCGACPMNRTVWWALAMDGYDLKQLSPEQRTVAARIVAEGPGGEGPPDAPDR